MRTQVVDGVAIESDNKLLVRTLMHGRGITTKELPRVLPKKTMCEGCHDNFYNRPGNSASGECWAFKTAKVVNKVGYSSIHCANGPDTIMKRTLSCWHGIVK